MLRQVVLICSLLAVATAWTAIGFVKPIPEAFKVQTGCYLEDLDEVAPLGVSKSKTGCFEIHCGETMYKLFGCTSVILSEVPSCEETEDEFEKQYPECCPFNPINQCKNPV